MRWRQLVDLIARAGPGIESEQMTRALAVIDADASRVDIELRAASARAIAHLALPPALLTHFMSEPLSVSAPILAAAKLEPEHWRAMLATADPEIRAFVESLHPYLASTPLRAEDKPTIWPEGTSLAPRRSLGEVVERIERRRRRAERAPAMDVPPVDGVRLFRFECDHRGEVSWVDGAPRGPLIGRSIAAADSGDGGAQSEDIAVAMARRAAFRDAPFSMAAPGTLAGMWRLSAAPAFDPLDGRFAGYRGVARRNEAAGGSPGSHAALLLREPDSLRELVHELRTPLNAILGFAEIIDGQYLGPAGRRYRQTAAGIATKARLLIEGIEDLDLAARLQGGELSDGASSDLGGIANRAVAGIRREANDRGITIDFPGAGRAYEVKAGGQYVGRLAERLFKAVMMLASDGEIVRVTLDADPAMVRLSITCPLADAGRCGPEPEQLEGDADPELFAGLFSVRLVARLANLAGGSLGMVRGSLILALPRR